MANVFQIAVFGDLSVPYHSELRRLFSEKRDYVLATLFTKSYYAVKSEISRLPPSQRAQFPFSSNIEELLNADKESTTSNYALDSFFFCLCQISSFVSHLNRSGTSYPRASSSCLASRCIGLLAAVAISCSENVYDLVSIAPEVVALAFRVGLLVQGKTKSVTLSSGNGASCSTVIAGLDEPAASQLLNAYFDNKGAPALSRVYVSAVGSGTITLSGPPAQLKEFLSHHSDLKAGKIQVGGLFHSPSLYTDADVSGLVASATAHLRGRVARIPVILNGHEKQQELVGGETCQHLLEVVVSDILRHQMRWDLAAERVIRAIRRSGCSAVELLPFVAGSVEGLSSVLRATMGIDRVDVPNTAGVDSSSRGSGHADAEKQPARSKIAIIGFSGRYPEADDNEEFWELLAAGLDVHREIPKERFDPYLYFDPTCKKKNTSGVTKGCFVRNPDLFDSRFFSMSPREADQADPAQRFALMTAYEAMEMAGFVPDSTPSSQRSRVGVFYGTASDDYREINAAQNVDTYFVPGGSRAFLPARINYHFRFSGPSFDVDTACSSGLAAVHIACNSLWAEDCDVAIAGGTNILTNPDNWAGLDRAHFLSRTGNCNTFDDAADGYCRSDTVATVILKRLEDALLDGDPVFGTILGAYTNHSAEAVSMTRPHSGAQRAICTRILRSSNVDCSEVSYVEMHGTGTQHGDATEMDSVLSVFAPDTTSRKSPLFIGSVKANVGHAESAAGISSLVKVLLMMQKNAIPRHVGIKTKLNRNFPKDLVQRNVHISLENRSWPRPDPRVVPHGRRVFINNFGAAGGNSSVLVEDAPVRPAPERDDASWPVHAVAVSAKTQNSFKENIRALIAYLETRPDVSLGSLSYTTTARRIHYSYRTAVVGSSVDEIRNALHDVAAREKHLSTAGGGPPIGFSFTGQGSQYLGMGKKLLSLPQFESLLAGLDGIVRLQGFPSILDVVSGKAETPIEDMSPVKVQLAIACLEMALGKFWIALGVVPQIVVGHSLGEYAALNIAGVLSDADTIHLVGTRARLLEKACSMGSHSMLAVKASAAEASSLRSSSHPDLDIACINGPEDTVVAGSNSQIEAFKDLLNGRSVKSTQVKVQFAFHSAQVEPMLEAFRQACGAVVVNEPSIPVISPLLGRVMKSASDIGPVGDYLARHCRETVNFCEGVLSARNSGLIPDKMMWVEVGPHPICSNMLRSTLGSSTQTIPSLRRGEDDCKIFTPALAKLYDSGLAINWGEYHAGAQQTKQVLLLPSYRWELKSHWIPYTNDWCLTKGDAPAPQLLALPEAAAAAAAAERRLFTTSVQYITAESYGAQEASMTARTDVQHPDFREVLLAHQVNGRPVCSSAVYADMAYTMFSRMLEKSSVPFDKSDLGIEVADMAADKSLILNDDPSPQMLELKASVNWSTRQGSFSMSSISSADGKPTAKHAKCSGFFTDKSRWKSEWKRRDFLVKSRIQELRSSVHDDSGSVHMIKTGMFYKLFTALVDYRDSFKGCRELVMRSADLESTAKVRFNTPAGTADKWKLPPHWLDSLGQITGFTMNGNDEVDSKNQVYINHGWDNMKICGVLSDQTTYNTYLKMQPKDKGSYCGDVYIFNQDMDEVVAVYEGVTFAAVQRKVLDLVLPKPKAAAQSGAAAAAAAAAPSQRQQQQQQQQQQQPAQPVAASQESGMDDMPPTLVPSEKKDVPSEKLKVIIAEEVGASISDVQDDAELAPLGVDSLLALTISDRMLEELGLRVDSSAFISCITVAELVRHILGSSTPSSDSGPATPSITPLQEPDFGTSALSERIESAFASVQVESDRCSDTTQYGDEKADAVTKFASIKPLEAVEIPPATSVLLQGNPRTCTRKVWLFPDGSGSAASYMPLPDVDPAKVAIYGLSSPFIKHTATAKPCQFGEMTAAYVAEMRRRQPSGPYSVGGWSAGGLCAYDAAQRLVADGETVDALILIDSPNPIGLKELPPRLYNELSRLNVFGAEPGAKVPEWLVPHFKLFADILVTCKLRPWQAAKPLPAWALWARNGVDENQTIERWPSDPENMTWLLNRRTQAILGCNGWDELLGKKNITVGVVEGAHHFSMLKQPAVPQVSDFLRTIMESTGAGI